MSVDVGEDTVRAGGVLDRITTLAPRFRERAPQTEADRTVPRTSIDELLDAGLARLLVPTEYGGTDAPIRDMVELTAAAAYGCPSTGWIAGLMMSTPHAIRLMSPEAQQAVWGNGPDVVVSNTVMPSGRAEKVDGGYRLTGKHAFCSGVNNADWAFLGGMVGGGSDQPEWRLFLLPREQYRIEDVWDTAGMRGTGSNTIVTDDVFVPQEHTLDQADAREGTGPGFLPGQEIPLPWIGYSILTFTSTMLGAAQSAFDSVRTQLAGKRSPSGQRVADAEQVQVALGLVAVKIATARTLLLQIADRADSGRPYLMDERSSTGRDNAFAAVLLGEAVDALLELTGTSGFAAGSTMQQVWRDVHFALSHVSVNKTGSFGRYGRTALGVDELSMTGFF